MKLLKMDFPLSIFIGIFLMGSIGCAEESEAIKMDNLFAWCIIPYDAKERNTEERIAMLQKLGIESYAIDWRDEHLDILADEIVAARENDIDVEAMWLWVDNTNQPDSLNETNERVLAAVDSTDIETTFWLGINSNFFEGLSMEASMDKLKRLIAYLDDRAQALDCKLALYNHGDWFGEPMNMVKVLSQLQDRNVGIVYNFHHAHPQLEDLEANIKAMLPYLVAVNLNGMNPDGPKILPIGKGSEEKQMIEKVLNAGFTGPFGILGHVEDRDVELVLQENLDGLKDLGFVANDLDTKNIETLLLRK